MRTLKFAFMGFGNVGQMVSRLLIDRHDDFVEKYGCDIKVTAIATNTKGNMVDPEGIDLEGILKDITLTGRFSEDRCTDLTAMEILQKVDYDCAVEMSPLNIFTGQPATDYMKTAISRGKHAITANKGPIAWHFRELKKLAMDKNVGFFYETVVMDGTPVFNMAEHTLKMTRVRKVEGILNTTTNFILEEMAKGVAMDEILAEGRARGFVEADPAMDIEGYDAAAKITALLNVLMDADITPDKVQRKGIEDITYDDIESAKARGKMIKLVCKGELDDDGNVIATVAPEEVEQTGLYASITGTTSVVSITTDMMGKLSIVEHDPEIEQTAYGVFGDIIRVIEFGQ